MIEAEPQRIIDAFRIFEATLDVGTLTAMMDIDHYLDGEERAVAIRV